MVYAWTADQAGAASAEPADIRGALPSTHKHNPAAVSAGKTVSLLDNSVFAVADEVSARTKHNYCSWKRNAAVAVAVPPEAERVRIAAPAADVAGTTSSDPGAAIQR